MSVTAIWVASPIGIPMEERAEVSSVRTPIVTVPLRLALVPIGLAGKQNVEPLTLHDVGCVELELVADVEELGEVVAEVVVVVVVLFGAAVAR